MHYDVFVCHCSEDHEMAMAIVNALEPEIRCCIAPRDLTPAQKFAESIVSRMEHSRMVMFLLTDHHRRSDHIVAEVDIAFSLRLPIMTVRLEDVDPSKAIGYYIRTSHWVDGGMNTAEPDVSEIRRAIGAVLAANDDEPVEPRRIPTQHFVAPTPTPTPTPVEPASVAAGPAEWARHEDSALRHAAEGDDTLALDEFRLAYDAAVASATDEDVVRIGAEAAFWSLAFYRRGAALALVADVMPTVLTLPTTSPARHMAQVMDGACRRFDDARDRLTPSEARDIIEGCDRALPSGSSWISAAEVQLEVALYLDGENDLAQRQARNLVNDLARSEPDAMAKLVAFQAAREVWAYEPADPEGRGALLAADILASVPWIETPGDSVWDVASAALRDALASWNDDERFDAVVARLARRLGTRHALYVSFLLVGRWRADARGDQIAGRALLTEAHDTLHRLAGSGDPFVILLAKDLIALDEERGDHERAIAGATRLAKQVIERDGPDNAPAVVRRTAVARLIGNAGRHEESVALLDEALSEAPGLAADSIEVLDARRLRATYLAYITGRGFLACADEALAIWDDYRRVFGDDDITTRHLGLDYADAAFAVDRLAVAAEVRKVVLDSYRTTPGPFDDADHRFLEAAAAHYTHLDPVTPADVDDVRWCWQRAREVAAGTHAHHQLALAVSSAAFRTGVTLDAEEIDAIWEEQVRVLHDPTDVGVPAFVFHHFRLVLYVHLLRAPERAGQLARPSTWISVFGRMMDDIEAGEEHVPGTAAFVTALLVDSLQRAVPLERWIDRRHPVLVRAAAVLDRHVAAEDDWLMRYSRAAAREAVEPTQGRDLAVELWLSSDAIVDGYIPWFDLSRLSEREQGRYLAAALLAGSLLGKWSLPGLRITALGILEHALWHTTSHAGSRPLPPSEERAQADPFVLNAPDTFVLRNDTRRDVAFQAGMALVFTKICETQLWGASQKARDDRQYAATLAVSIISQMAKLDGDVSADWPIGRAWLDRLEYPLMPRYARPYLQRLVRDPELRRSHDPWGVVHRAFVEGATSGALYFHGPEDEYVRRFGVLDPLDPFDQL